MKRILNLFPCVTISDDSGVKYIQRYYIFKTRLISIYIHHIMADDEANMHDHPWPFIVVILKGGYWECMPNSDGFIKPIRVWRHPGSVMFHKPSDIHRIELPGFCFNPEIRKFENLTSWSLVILGPKIREWGFHTKTGWIHFKNYLAKKFVKECE